MRWSYARMLMAIAGLAACDGHEMEDQVAEIREHLTDVEQEHARHASAIASAADLDAVAEEEHLHASRTRVHLDGMSGAMAEMRGCNDMHGGSHAYRMDDRLAEMGDACEDHQRAMLDFVSMDEARGAELIHQDEMDLHLGQMRDEADGMMREDGDGVDCPGTFHP